MGDGFGHETIFIDPFISRCGFLLDYCHQTIDLLNKTGIKTELHESGGYHAWTNWRDYLNEFAPLLFQPTDPKNALAADRGNC